MTEAADTDQVALHGRGEQHDAEHRLAKHHRNLHQAALHDQCRIEDEHERDEIDYAP